MNINKMVFFLVVSILFILFVSFNTLMVTYSLENNDAILGDVNGDGKINSDDALLIARYILGDKLSNFSVNAADVNHDNKIKMSDAMLILLGKVTIPIPVENVDLNITDASISVGGNLFLNASVYPENASDKAISYTTSNSNVATVDSNGMVIGISPGTVIISAKDSSGMITANSKVIVKEKIRLMFVGNSKVYYNMLREFTIWIANNYGYKFDGKRYISKNEYNKLDGIYAPFDYDKSQFDPNGTNIYIDPGDDSSRYHNIFYTNLMYSNNKSYDSYYSFSVGGTYLQKISDHIEEHDNIKDVLANVDGIDYLIWLLSPYDISSNSDDSIGDFKDILLTNLNYISETKNPDMKIYLRYGWKDVDTSASYIEGKYDSFTQGIQEINEIRKKNNKREIKTIYDGTVINIAKENNSICPVIVKEKEYNSDRYDSNVHQSYLGAYSVALSINLKLFGIDPIGENIYLPEVFDASNEMVENTHNTISERNEIKIGNITQAYNFYHTYDLLTESLKKESKPSCIEYIKCLVKEKENDYHIKNNSCNLNN